MCLCLMGSSSPDTFSGGCPPSHATRYRNAPMICRLKFSGTHSHFLQPSLAYRYGLSPLQMYTRAPGWKWRNVGSCNMQVEALEEVSARTNVGRRCFQRMVLCNLWHFWHWPPGRHWLDGLRPNSVAQQVSLLFSLLFTSRQHTTTALKLREELPPL